MFIRGRHVSTTWFQQSIGLFIFAHTSVPRMNVANKGYTFQDIGQFDSCPESFGNCGEYLFALLKL